MRTIIIICMVLFFNIGCEEKPQSNSEENKGKTNLDKGESFIEKQKLKEQKAGEIKPNIEKQKSWRNLAISVPKGTTEEELQNVEELLRTEIKTLHSAYVSKQELADTKAYLKGAFAASQETVLALSFMVSLNELYGLGFDHHQRYDDRIDRVTNEDIQRLARKYLDLNKMAIVITNPGK